MIILCDNCAKKFKLDSALIPEKGRLLRCNSCNHKWFFKKEIINKPISSINIVIPTKVEAVSIKKSEPKPMNKSLDKYPVNILHILKRPNGIPINKGNSCTFLIITLYALVGA